MRVRTRYDGSFWIGEVYGTWTNIFGSYTGWNRVTDRCWTEIGATIQLKNYARKTGRYFEL